MRFDIISTDSEDQGLANRPSKVITEMERIHKDKGLATPEEVLAATNGNFFIRNRPKEDTPYVDDLIDDIKACRNLYHLPVVKIIDNTSKPSSTAWPF